MTNVRVTPVRIVMAGSNAPAIVIPLIVVAVAMLVPALVLAVVVAVAVVIIIVAVLVPALCLPWSSSCGRAKTAGEKANTGAARANNARSFFMFFSPKDR